MTDPATFEGMAVHAFNIAEDCLYDARDFGPSDACYTDLIHKAIDNLREARRMLRRLQEPVQVKVAAIEDEESYEKSEKDCMWERE